MRGDDLSVIPLIDLSSFPGVGAVNAMEILHEFSGEGLEGLKKFK